MSRNLVKFYNANEQDTTKLIDTNSRMEKIIQEALEEARKKQERQARERAAAAGEAGDDGFVEGLEVSQLDALTADTGEVGNIIKAPDAGAQAEGIIQEAKDKADDIVATAEQLAEEYKTNTRRETEIECNRMRADARNEGYDLGIQQARDEYADRLRALDVKERSLEEEYNSLCADLESRMVSTLTGIYEQIFNVELSDYEPLIAGLLAKTMHRVESSRSYIVHVSADDYETINKDQRKTLEEAAPGCTVEVVEDVGLKRNQCLLETDNGVFDCGLDTQLREIRKKLMLLSYDPGMETAD